MNLKSVCCGNDDLKYGQECEKSVSCLNCSFFNHELFNLRLEIRITRDKLNKLQAEHHKLTGVYCND